jgi:hypothetical protein
VSDSFSSFLFFYFFFIFLRVKRKWSFYNQGKKLQENSATIEQGEEKPEREFEEEAVR